jgi:predicted transcriptional regulator
LHGQKEEDSPVKPVFNTTQFAELKKLLQTYVRITAIGYIREMSDSEMQRNTWLLNEAGYIQPEIAKMLGTSQPTVSRILAGKPAKGKSKQEETK